MKVAVISPDKKAEKAIKQLLFPWKAEFTTSDKADVVIKYKTLENTGKPTIIIPSETVEFNRWVKEKNLKTVEMLEKKVKVPATDTLMLTLSPQTQRVYIKSSYSKNTDDETLVTRIDDYFLLPVDLIEEYGFKLSQTLNPKISSIYRFLTGLPIPYTLAPSRLRNFFFSAGKVGCDNSYFEYLDLDALRYLLISAIQEATGKSLQKKSWTGFRYACLITHDVDTREGLKRALLLKKVEERFDIPSTWFLPTKRYNLESGVILQLANYGEVGAHGTKHNGKLIQLSIEKIIDIVRASKLSLESIVKQEVLGFRAPLLQHNKKIIQSLSEVGYSYDTSIPTWEPRHPSTMGPHGIGTVYPLKINKITEIPVSIPQDHQMFRVLGMNLEQTVEKWIEFSDIIRSLGGIYTVLIHSDYEFSSMNGLNAYEEFLNFLVGDSKMYLTTPMEVVKKCL